MLTFSTYTLQDWFLIAAVVSVIQFAVRVLFAFLAVLWG